MARNIEVLAPEILLFFPLQQQIPQNTLLVSHPSLLHWSIIEVIEIQFKNLRNTVCRVYETLHQQIPQNTLLVSHPSSHWSIIEIQLGKSVKYSLQSLCNTPAINSTKYRSCITVTLVLFSSFFSF